MSGCKFSDDQVRGSPCGFPHSYHTDVCSNSNGKDVGYSQGARNPSEFDITTHLTADTSNNISVRVYELSDGTYLEDQDQWRMSGIFRDVYLLPFAENSIVDFEAIPVVADDLASATLLTNVTVQGTAIQVNLTLFHPNGSSVYQSAMNASTILEIPVLQGSLELWSAETPSLYTLVLSSWNQHISQKVGFRRIELSSNEFLVNGKAVILYGVNRHEHTPTTGRTVPYEFMRADLIRMKQSNINSIRTSHYPPHPNFFEVADELGFYVIAEADLECHGFGFTSDNDIVAAEWTSSNPDWTAAYLDRAEQLVERLKNHVSIIFWSLGNECFYGTNHVLMYEYIKQRDPTRLVHYQPDMNATSTDMYSRMYLDMDGIDEILGNFTDKPFILVEFAHALGNGPGGLSDYIKKFRSSPGLQGGHVWQWSGHGLLTKTPDGTPYYGYGGDFGDFPNDKDWVFNGLVYSDHTPEISLWEYSKTIQPVEVQIDNSTNEVVITNHYDFIDLSKLEATWYVVTDGNESSRTVWDIPQVLPGTNVSVPLPNTNSTTSGESWLFVEFRLRNATVWAEKGHVVAWEQLHLPQKPASSPMRYARQLMSRQSGMNVTQNATHIVLQVSENVYDFDLLRGNVSWRHADNPILQRGPELNFDRALTQNDEAFWGDFESFWDNARIREMHPQIRDVFWSDPSSENAMTIKFSMHIGPKEKEWGCQAQLTYTIRPSEPAALTINVRGDFFGNNTPPTLPRIGMLTVLPQEFNQASWFGRGPHENYRDCKQSARMGNYAKTVDDLFTYYDFPQENGNRGDLRWLEVGNNVTGTTLRVTMDDDQGKMRPFDFNARHFHWQDLYTAEHPFKLPERKRNETFLNIDYAHNGIGSASVSVRPFPWDRLEAGPFEFNIRYELV